MDNGGVGIEGHRVGFAGGFLAGSREVMRAANSIVVHTRKVAEVFIVCFVGLVIFYAMDREPPFEMLSVEPASAKAGEMVTIKMKVRRDISRNCDGDIDRWMIDSGGAELHIGRVSRSAEAFKQLEQQTPGSWETKLLVPHVMRPGQGFFKADNRYYCNKTQKLMVGELGWLWAIRSTTVVPFTVLPP